MTTIHTHRSFQGVDYLCQAKKEEEEGKNAKIKKIIFFDEFNCSF